MTEVALGFVARSQVIAVVADAASALGAVEQILLCIVADALLHLSTKQI